MSQPEIMLWTPGAGGFDLPDTVQDTRDLMNHQGFDQVMLEAPIHREITGSAIDHCVLSSAGSSTTELLAIINPYANRISDHHIVKGEFVRRVLRDSGICDYEGNEIPVALFSAPSRGSSLRLRWEDLNTVRQGFLEPVSTEYLDAIKRLGFGKVALSGHSQAGAIALNAASYANSLNLDVVSVASSDQPGTKYFTKFNYMKAFAGDADYLRTEVVEANLTPYTEAMGFGSNSSFESYKSNASYLLDILIHPKINGALMSGLRQLFFERDIKSAARHTEAPILIGIGSDDALMADSHEVQFQAREAQSDRENIHLLEVAGARHTWSDDVPLWSSFVLESYFLIDES